MTTISSGLLASNSGSGTSSLGLLRVQLLPDQLAHLFNDIVAKAFGCAML